MLKKIDFKKEKPVFVHQQFNWYIDKYFQDYLENKQADNLPKLKNLGCFVVHSDESTEFVLIDNKQNVLEAYPYNGNGFEQMVAMINILKISKHYDEHEQ